MTNKSIEARGGFTVGLRSDSRIVVDINDVNDPERALIHSTMDSVYARWIAGELLRAAIMSEEMIRGRLSAHERADDAAIKNVKETLEKLEKSA